MTFKKPSPIKRTPRLRLAAVERRRQIVATAARLLTRYGVDRVQISEVAQAAKVTRPIVYKFFTNRQALIVAVLEDFEAELNQRFFTAWTQTNPDSLDTITRAFVDAVCDTVEVKGAGPWRLLDAKGPDKDVAKAGHKILDRMVAPWLSRIAEATGSGPKDVLVLAHMLVAGGRAVLELWFEGKVTREEAIGGTTRGVSALLQAFASGKTAAGQTGY